MGMGLGTMYTLNGRSRVLKRGWHTLMHVIYMHGCMDVYVLVHVYLCRHTYIYACMCNSIYIYIYIYIYIHTNKHTHK